MKRSFLEVLNDPAKNRGQILLEVLIAVAAVATLSATIAALVVVAQRGQEAAKRRDAAANIAAEVFAAISALSDADLPAVTQGYNRLYCPPDGICEDDGYPETTGKDPSNVDNRYRPILVGNNFDLTQGEVTEQLAGFDFTHYLTIQNVCRNFEGNIVGTWVNDIATDCPNEGGVLNPDTDDPYTQKVVATFAAPRIEDIVFSRFFTRSTSVTSAQGSWSGVVVSDRSGDGVIEFTIYWNNDDDEDPGTDEPAKIFLCKSEVQPINFECPQDSWTELPTFAVPAEFTSPQVTVLEYNPTPADIGVNDFWVYVCDMAGQCSYSDDGGDPKLWPNHGTFTVN